MQRESTQGNGSGPTSNRTGPIIGIMSPVKSPQKRNVTAFYFCKFFERELAGLRARSFSQGKSSCRIAAAGRLKKSLRARRLRGKGIQRTERERSIGDCMQNRKRSGLVAVMISPSVARNAVRGFWGNGRDAAIRRNRRLLPERAHLFDATQNGDV